MDTDEEVLDEVDAGDEESVKARRKAARLAEKERDQMLVAIMDIPQGRRWIWALLEEYGLMANVFGVDTHLTYFAGGQQDVAKRIFADILRACPNHYITMIKENGNG